MQPVPESAELPKERYWSSFWQFFIYIALPSTLIVMPLVLHDVRQRHSNVMTVGQLPCMILVADAAWACIWIWLNPVLIGPHSIRCYNFWEIYSTIRWDEVATSRRVRIAGMPYFNVVAESGRTIYVPVWMSEQGLFRERVRHLAGDDNPLTLALFPEKNTTAA